MPSDFKPSVGLQPAIQQRRATRSFHPNPIPDAILEKIFSLSLYAPSGYNLQPWRFIVVRDEENRQKLKECAFNQQQVGEAPVILICCGDRDAASQDNIEAVIKLGQEHNAINEDYAEKMRSMIPSFFENQPSFGTMEAWINRHTMIAVTHVMIVAKAYGVDSCPMEGFAQAKVKEAFNIPDTVDVCCLLALGFADEPHKRYGGRFGIEQVFSSESYGQPFSFDSGA
jgi:nitroreductase